MLVLFFSNSRLVFSRSNDRNLKQGFIHPTNPEITIQHSRHRLEPISRYLGHRFYTPHRDRFWRLQQEEYTSIHIQKRGFQESNILDYVKISLGKYDVTLPRTLHGGGISIKNEKPPHVLMIGDSDKYFKQRKFASSTSPLRSGEKNDPTRQYTKESNDGTKPKILEINNVSQRLFYTGPAIKHTTSSYKTSNFEYFPPLQNSRFLVGSDQVRQKYAPKEISSDSEENKRQCSQKKLYIEQKLPCNMDLSNIKDEAIEIQKNADSQSSILPKKQIPKQRNTQNMSQGSLLPIGNLTSFLFQSFLCAISNLKSFLDFSKKMLIREERTKLAKILVDLTNSI